MILPPGTSSFAFTMDNDLIKLVTLTPDPGTLAISVRYATDVVVEQQHRTIALSAAPSILADGMGLVISWRAPLIGWLKWPEITRTRRF